jgi:metallophosphoesterase (TIGR00282 family)
MKILFIGDVVAEPGRRALEQYLPILREKLKPDSVIINGENSAHGIGITPKIADGFFDLGVDCITGGNHSFDKREIIAHMANEPRLIRPLNYPNGTPGNGVFTYRDKNGKYITVINAMARLFVDCFLDCPFRSVDRVLEQLKLGIGSNAIIVDFHGEATSEKLAFGNYFDGRVTAVLGTHTHIPTADHRVLPKGTAYQTDVGMTGCYESIIGMDKDVPIQGFTKNLRDGRMEPAVGDATVCGCLITIDNETGLASAIKPVRIGGNELENTI